MTKNFIPTIKNSAKKNKSIDFDLQMEPKLDSLIYLSFYARLYVKHTNKNKHL